MPTPKEWKEKEPWLAPKPKPKPKPVKRFYTIESGDTYGIIASRFGTTVDQLRALNPGVDEHALTVGQRIRVK